MPVELEVEGLAKALDMLSAGNTRIAVALARANTYSVELLRNRLAKYPSKSEGKMNGFKSDKQRRLIFAKIRAGEIPYKRKGILGRRWTTRGSKVNTIAGETIGIVGNISPYAPFVQGHSMQAHIHMGNWQTEVDVLNSSRKEILEAFNQEISAALAEENA